MKQEIFRVLENHPLARSIYRLTLSGDTSAITAPGQFVNIRINGFYLRRPISVCDWEEGKLILIYKTVGEGTQALAAMSEGTQLDLLTGLGNGFNLQNDGCSPLLVGGGVGTPPLYALAKLLRKKACRMTVVLGFAGAQDVFYTDEFSALGAQVFCATQDGSHGTPGTVIDALQAHKPAFDYSYACGPMPMLRALYNYTDIPGQFSFEERMGCGFGACMGCTCHTVTGSKRICKDGPVLTREEILWRT